MLKITSLNVRSMSLDHLDLFWEVSHSPGPSRDVVPEFLDYDFYVLRSGDTAMGPFEVVAGPLRDQYMLRDPVVETLNKHRQYYYKIRIVHRPTGNSEEFGPVGSGLPPQDLIASEVTRQEDLLFRELVGRKCWLFKARTFGPRCSCWDPVLSRVTRAAHLPCFGTGFLSGYHAPIEIYVQIDPPGKLSQPTSFQEMQPQDTQGRMISFPPVNPKDILVESENKRWRVGRVTQTERLRSSLRQEFALHMIPMGDIEYQLPMNVDLQNLQPASVRNFKNSQNLEDDGDYSEIFSTFGHPRGTLR